jgi:hypothetical protein
MQTVDQIGCRMLVLIRRPYLQSEERLEPIFIIEKRTIIFGRGSSYKTIQFDRVVSLVLAIV